MDGDTLPDALAALNRARTGAMAEIADIQSGVEGADLLRPARDTVGEPSERSGERVGAEREAAPSRR